MKSEENLDLEPSLIPIRKGSLSPPEKEKAPINIRGKNKLSKLLVYFLKRSSEIP